MFLSIKLLDEFHYKKYVTHNQIRL